MDYNQILAQRQSDKWGQCCIENFIFPFSKSTYEYSVIHIASLDTIGKEKFDSNWKDRLKKGFEKKIMLMKPSPPLIFFGQICGIKKPYEKLQILFLNSMKDTIALKEYIPEHESFDYELPLYLKEIKDKNSTLFAFHDNQKDSINFYGIDTFGDKKHQDLIFK